MPIVVNQEEKIELICQKAYDEFIQNGIENISLNQLITNIGISKGQFYHYFKTLRNLKIKVSLIKDWCCIIKIKKKINIERKSKMKIIECKDLTKEYISSDSTVKAVDNVSISFEQGEFCAVTGPSGSGKSTLMKCVNLLEQVDDGQIWLGNTDITDPRADQDKIRARIGVVFQQFNLFPHMSVLRNVTLAAIKVHHWSKDRAETRAMELLERIGMRDKASAYPDQLSGGQQQRVAIARALMTDPELLLLDEITSALDPMLVGEVLNMVAELKAQGTTILMATHEMSFAHEAADRIVLLRHGVIAENGTPAEVMDESQDPETIEFFSHFRH